MSLIESISTYTGEVFTRIQMILTDEAKNLIEKIASKTDVALGDSKLVEELIEMDVLCMSGGQIIPNTAIFLQKDIEMIYDPVFEIGARLAEIVNSNAGELIDCSPNIRNFIGSIMGMGQGLHAVLKSKGLASNWQNKTGKYERSKVDFNQDCKAYRGFGDDLQIKRIYRARRFSSIIIGAGRENYFSYLWNDSEARVNSETRIFCTSMMTYLTDVFPQLIAGEVEDEALQQAAIAAHIDIRDKSCVITKREADKYQPIIEKISQACSEYILEDIGLIKGLLQATEAGKQGVSAERMMMNLWRYVRRAAAIKLYENGFLCDKIPEQGSITLFFDNEIGYF